MRGWLVSIGFGGSEGKETRSFFLKGLKGHTAFRTPEDAEKWKANRKAESRKPYALENKSHFLMPQQRIARTESRLCGGAFTAAFQRLKRENSGIQLSALC